MLFVVTMHRRAILRLSHLRMPRNHHHRFFFLFEKHSLRATAYGEKNRGGLRAKFSSNFLFEYFNSFLSQGLFRIGFSREKSGSSEASTQNPY